MKALGFGSGRLLRLLRRRRLRRRGRGRGEAQDEKEDGGMAEHVRADGPGCYHASRAFAASMRALFSSTDSGPRRS